MTPVPGMSVSLPSELSSRAPLLEMMVAAKSREAESVVSLELRGTTGEVLPVFTPGAHIELELPTPAGVLLRQYSLVNDPAERRHYMVAVGRDACSRGGSQWIHECLAPGQVLRVGVPRNNFPLNEEAGRSVFIAGGIGITPLLAMARRLSELGRHWTLYYCVRTPAQAAFIEPLMRFGGEVVPVFDRMPGVASLDVGAVVRRAAPDTHLYCCGPSGLMQAFATACRSRDPRTVHLEWFSAPVGSALEAPSSEFVVHLARSGITLPVPADRSILDVVRAAGIDVPHSCLEGICGSCETKVVSGECDHRDLILADRSSNGSMMICVSRAKGATLTLDV